MRMRNGDLRTWGEWVQFGVEAQRQAEIIEVNERRTKSVVTGNVIGGSLDGANLPAGTRNGQRLTWDATRQRWIG